MNRRLFLTAIAAATALPLIAQPAHAATWQFLGLREVNGLADFDSIRVGAATGPFTHIRLKVRGNALWLYDLDVRFSNGAKQDVPVRLRIPQGGETRQIDLRGASRNIRRVNFTYGKLPNGRGATYVELWGMR